MAKSLNDVSNFSRSQALLHTILRIFPYAPHGTILVRFVAYEQTRELYISEFLAQPAELLTFAVKSRDCDPRQSRVISM